MAWHDMQKQLEKNRRPEDIHAARASTHIAGMSSNGAAALVERQLMTAMQTAIATLRKMMIDGAAISECREHQLRSAADGLDALISDYSLDASWNEDIRELSPAQGVGR